VVEVISAGSPTEPERRLTTQASKGAACWRRPGPPPRRRRLGASGLVDPFDSSWHTWRSPKARGRGQIRPTCLGLRMGRAPRSAQRWASTISTPRA